ncbi:MAG: restriction endonuclease subunit S [Prosthecobacter sp.]|uniref:restriction endonuclease subunit S n=1 Tax=Prosthecobacter sp. TaxID=1965333 RepID=UPI003BB20F40
MSFSRYPRYKDSGVEWIGQVPEHWDVIAGRRLFQQKREPGLPSDEQLSATQKYGVVPQKLFMEMQDQKVTLALSGIDNFKHVEAGDFVISLRSFQGGIERSEYSGCVSPAYTVLRPTAAVEGGLWRYLLKSKGYIEALQSKTEGIRDGKNISFEQFGEIRVPVIPPAEQIAIAEFLDRETGGIDELVAEQRRLMELLKEKRQAVISNAVTRGLNTAAPLKPSGIEWLGDVPKHWSVQPLFLRYQAVLGKMVDEKHKTGEHPVSYLRNADVNWDRINISDLPTFDVTPEEEERCLLRAGDLLICEGGAGVGQTSIWQGELERCAFQKALHRLRPWSNNEMPRFLYYCMRYAVESGVVLAGGTATIPHLTGEQLRRYRFPCPPVEEQRQIVKFLDFEAQKYDALMGEAQRAIDLLQERRTALISAAVTGQIDVRQLNSKEIPA